MNHIPDYQNEELSFEERAKDLVSRMTLEEKISQMQYDTPAIERLGVPSYNWWNGQACQPCFRGQSGWLPPLTKICFKR